MAEQILVPKIMAWLENPRHAVPADVLAECGARAIRAVARQFGDPRQTDGTPLRMSSLGKCARAGWYQFNKAEPTPMQPRSRLVFAFGETIESDLIALCFLAGVPVISTNKAVAATILGKEIPGHVDLTIRDGDQEVPVEIKSMSRRGFDEAERLGHPSPDFGYLDQLQAYIRALDVTHGYFLCANKEQGHLAEYRIERDPSYVDRAANYVESVMADQIPKRPYASVPEVVSIQGKVAGEAYREANPTHTPLDRRGSFYPFETGRRVLPVTCGYCKMNSICYNYSIVMETSKEGKPTWVVPAESAK